MAIGNSPCSSVRKRTNSVAMANASTLAIKNPASASMKVTAKATASERSTVAAMAVGDGKRYSGMPRTVTMPCQATSSSKPNSSGGKVRVIIGRS